jgi:hypothetical protein
MALRAAAEPFAPEAFDRAFRAAFERGYEEWGARESRAPIGDRARVTATTALP